MVALRGQITMKNILEKEPVPMNEILRVIV